MSFCHRAFVIFVLSATSSFCHGQGLSAQPSPARINVSDSEFRQNQDAANRRIEECLRSLPILISEASPEQISQACSDKYGLHGSYVQGCYQQVLKIHASEGKRSSLESEAKVRGQCSAREQISGIDRQPFDEIPSTSLSSGNETIFIWPAMGKVSKTYSESSKGIDITGPIGSPVVAAADGKVVYAGSGLREYGNLIIIKHNNDQLTAYAHGNRFFVKEGETLTQGQKISEIGMTDSDSPKLHFELRIKGKPVDPLSYLPAR
jgi:hypothetical protein